MFTVRLLSFVGEGQQDPDQIQFCFQSMLYCRHVLSPISGNFNASLRPKSLHYFCWNWRRNPYCFGQENVENRHYTFAWTMPQFIGHVKIFKWCTSFTLLKWYAQPFNVTPSLLSKVQYSCVTLWGSLWSDSLQEREGLILTSWLTANLQINLFVSILCSFRAKRRVFRNGMWTKQKIEVQRANERQRLNTVRIELKIQNENCYIARA